MKTNRGTIARTLVVCVIGLVGLGLVLGRPSGHGRTPWWTDRAAIQRGARDFATGPCISCHTIAGISSAAGGADLSHEGRRRSVPWLMHELTHPTSPRPAIPAHQVRDLVAYLSSLR